MKKLFAAVMMAVFLAVSVHAATGDIAGVCYSTDIRTYLNGFLISSVNIGGETLISAEDMVYYGYDVMWYPDKRELHIGDTIVAKEITGCEVPVSSSGVGEVIGYYYETDIVTYLNGTPITAYNLGGRTYIHAEEMRGYSQTVTWHPESRILDINSMIKRPVWSMKLVEGKKQDVQGEGRFSLTYNNGNAECTGDVGYFDLNFSSGREGYALTLAFYQNQGLFYSEKLLSLLEGLAYYSVFNGEICPPENRFEDVQKAVRVSVNEFVTEKMNVSISGGNGHRDIILTIPDLPIWEIELIETIVIEIGVFS